MQIDTYIHGVPYGFSYKGAYGEKDVFFNRYYQKQRGINEMRIEAVNANGSNFYYYTYIIGKNVLDGANARTGSYLGITIRLDQYYTKAQNLYYLLDSFFNSYLLNQIITCDNNSYRFLIQEFDNNPAISQSLQELEKLISMCFSSSDLKSLYFNKSSNYARLNFADASDNEVQKALAQYGEVSISYDYPSHELQRLAAQKNEEINNLRNQANAKITEISNKANADVATARREKETAINDIKKQYADADKTINTLKSEVEKEKTEANKFKNQYKETKEKLERTERKLQEANRESAQYENIKGQMEQINSIVSEYTNNSHYETPEPPKRSHSKLKVSLYQLTLVQVVLSLIILLLLLILLVIQTNIPPSDPTTIEPGGISIVNKKDTVPQSGTLYVDYKAMYPNVRIDIKEFNKNKQSMIVNERCHFSIQNFATGVTGEWKSTSDNIQFEDNPTEEGTIVYAIEPGQYEIR